MSDLLPEMPKVKGDAQLVGAWISRVITLGALTCGLWLANQVWNEQKENRDAAKVDMRKLDSTIQSNADAQRVNIRNVEEAVNGLKTNMAVIEASRYTTADAIKAKEIIDGRFAEHERRIGRVEDTSTSIKDSLHRLEAAAGTKP